MEELEEHGTSGMDLHFSLISYSKKFRQDFLALEKAEASFNEN